MMRLDRHHVVAFCVLLCACGPVGDGVSNNTNQGPGSDAELSDLDQDGDGYSPATGDCDDGNPSINPAAMEIPGNGIDDDCDGLIDADMDGDGYTEAAGDCNDYDPTVYPHAPEDGGTGTGEADGVDNDCDGIIDNHLPTVDDDGDGFSEVEGDCDDNDIYANPGAYDVPGNELDEDCNGVPDDTVLECDATLAVDDNDAFSAAKAIGLCHQASENGPEWGVISARWITADGGSMAGQTNFDLGHGILGAFGSNVQAREGTKLLAISSGTARQPSDPGYQSPGGYDKGYTSGTAWGYAPSSPNCPGSVTTGTPHDSIALELRIRVPTNALSASFDFNFFTYEFPSWICSEYNDYFVALLDPTPPGQTDPNVSFDSGGNPISVNNALLQVCNPPQTAGGIYFPCPLGDSELQGTGFENHAATGWLQTTITVDPQALNNGEITILFGVWDSGDGVLDSTIIIDNWQWSAEPATGSTTRPVD